MWENDGFIYIYHNLPIITIEPTEDHTGWQACCGGRPVPQIPPGENLGEVMMRTVKYYDNRIEMTSVKERWLQP